MNTVEAEVSLYLWRSPYRVGQILRTVELQPSGLGQVLPLLRNRTFTSV
ncbi:MAG: hypothetical protein HC824_10285 [Synechococcales cyanobacterium RM1_1_8]|nr:hypothetical protein [Synechococcales cyanobacterium RM1_1_8]